MAVTDASALDVFFEEIKKLGFFGRLFSWGRIRKLSYEASNELAILRSERGNWLHQRHDLERLLESKKQEMDDKVNEVQRLSSELTRHTLRLPK